MLDQPLTSFEISVVVRVKVPVALFPSPTEILSAPGLSVTVPVPVRLALNWTSLPAIRVRFAPVIVAPDETTILLWASSVRRFPLAHVIALLTVISPACEPVARVCTITLPAASAFWRVVTLITELTSSAVGLNGEAPVLFKSAAEEIVMFVGSRRSVPF